MKYYVVSTSVYPKDINNEDVLRDALYSAEHFIGFTSKKDAEKFADDDIGAHARKFYPVYEMNIESKKGIVDANYTLSDGTAIKGYEIYHNQIDKQLLISATLKGNKHTFAVAASQEHTSTPSLSASQARLTPAKHRRPENTPAQPSTPTSHNQSLPTQSATPTPGAQPQTPQTPQTQPTQGQTPNQPVVPQAAVQPAAGQTVTTPAPVQTQVPLQEQAYFPAAYRHLTDLFTVAAAYFAITGFLILTKAIPTIAANAFIQGYAVPAVLLTNTITMPVVLITAALTAIGFGLGYSTISLYQKVRLAWDRCFMTPREIHNIDYPIAKGNLMQLETALLNKTAADNIFIEQLHGLEAAAPEATFNDVGNPLQATAIKTRPVVVQFEIDAMRRLSQVTSDQRAQTETALLQEARAKFAPAAN